MNALSVPLRTMEARIYIYGIHAACSHSHLKYRAGYIDLIEANGGVDPSYPVMDRYFNGNGLEQLSEKEFNKTKSPRYYN